MNNERTWILCIVQYYMNIAWVPPLFWHKHANTFWWNLGQTREVLTNRVGPLPGPAWIQTATEMTFLQLNQPPILQWLIVTLYTMHVAACCHSDCCVLSGPLSFEGWCMGLLFVQLLAVNWFERLCRYNMHGCSFIAKCRNTWKSTHPSLGALSWDYSIKSRGVP